MIVRKQSLAPVSPYRYVLTLVQFGHIHQHVEMVRKKYGVYISLKSTHGHRRQLREKLKRSFTAAALIVNGIPGEDGTGLADKGQHHFLLL